MQKAKAQSKVIHLPIMRLSNTPLANSSKDFQISRHWSFLGILLK